MSAPAPVGGARAVTSSTRSRRQEFERRQRRTSIAIAVASTTIFVGLLVWLLPKPRDGRRFAASFFDGEVFRDSFRPILRAFWLDIRIFLVCAPCIVVVALLVATARNVRTPALVPATDHGHRVHRRGTWCASDPVDHAARLRRSWAVADPRVVRPADHLGIGGPDPHLLGVRRRGLPCRDRECPRVAAGGGPLARALGRPDDAVGRLAPGRAPRRSPADERLREPAEGRRPDLASSVRSKPCAGRRSSRIGSSTSRRTSLPRCCSCACRSR